MKKRVLSFLLLLAMLVTMIPVMGAGVTAATGDEETPRSETGDSTPISDYYSLYKTDGLVAFFDALDPENGTLDLANGKWYAKVYNPATGQLEVSDTIYATVTGGAYNADSNVTGWQTYESGFGYADPNYASVTNVITIPRAQVLFNEATHIPYSNWTVDAQIRVDLRDVADKDGAVTGAFVFGAVSANHATNLQTGAQGKVTWVGGKDSTAFATNSTSFVDNNGKIASLVVSKTKVTEANVAYTVTHGAATSTTGNVAYANYFESGDVAVLKNEQGTVYAIRVYGSETGEALTAKEAAANATVDTLIRLDVDLAVFNKAVELGDGFAEKLISEILPANADLLNADKAAVEAAIEAAIAEEKEIRATRVLNDYEKLYVGADGSETANGGHLLSLFGSKDRSVDLENGRWINKIGEINATFGNFGYYKTEIWQKRADGGVGYTGLYGKYNEGGALVKVSETNNMADAAGSPHINTRLNLGMELLPTEDFTIEYVAKYMPIYVGDPNASDGIAREPNGTPIEYHDVNKNGIGSTQYSGALDYLGLISSWTRTRDGSSGDAQMPARGDVIWMITEGTPMWGYTTAWVGSRTFTGGGGMLASGIRENNKVHTYVYTRDETLTVSGGERTVDAIYSILRDAKAYTTSPKLSTANLATADVDGDGKINDEGKEDWGTVYYDNDTAGEFYLSSSIPTDFYGVRIYDAVLTEKELAHNTFIDIASYANASLDVYNSLDADTQEKVVTAMITRGFTTDPLEFAANLTELIDLYAKQVTAADTLYVQDGLRVLTTAYAGKDTGALVSDSSISWFNAARKGGMIELRGAEWSRRTNEEGAGYYILKSYESYDQMKTGAAPSFGIYLLPEMLPENSYSIELIVNPTGIVNFNENGTYERYIDSSTTYGITYENGFMIGPLRCLIFPADTDGGASRAGLEKRWCYDRGNKCWNPPETRNHKATEIIWRSTGIHDIVSYAIDYEIDSLTGKGEYTIYNDRARAASISIKPEDLISNEDANNAFQMMVGMPGGVFSVRVYDRVLTEAEKLQNHAADIIYYYDLDTTLLNKLENIFTEDSTVIYRGLSELSFDLPREEAQKIFDARLSALWLSFDGVAVRNDYTEGVRYYFTIDERTATVMLGAGFRIEVGAIANIGQNAMPSLDGRNYDYKIKAYDGVAGRNTGFFIDEDTFAITVKAGSDGKLAMLSKINVLGYIRLVSETGEEMIFYVDTPKSEYTPDSFFSIYNYMMEREDLITDAPLIDHLNLVTENCYEREYIHVMAGAAAGGNGTQEAPYNDFTAAFKAAKTRIKDINVPTYLYVYASEGVYEIHELLTVDGSEIPYEHACLVIASADGKGTLTSTRKIDNGAFKVEGNIWEYQFAADENGNFPDIRYIYVNGKIADIAHNGANNFLIADETRYMTRFYRWDIAPWLNAKAEYNAKRLKADSLFYPLNKVELNTRFAYYRDQYLVYRALNILETILPNTKNTVTNPSSYYSTHFETVKFNKLAYDEILALYNSTSGKNSEKLLATAKALENPTSKYAVGGEAYNTILEAELAAETAAKEAYDATVAQYETETATYNAALNAYNAAVELYNQKMAEITDTESPEYGEAVDAYEIAKTTFDAAVAAYAEPKAAIEAKKAESDAASNAVAVERAYFEAYVDAFDTIKAAVRAGIIDKNGNLKTGVTIDSVLYNYNLISPTEKYPTSEAVISTKVKYEWPAAPSTGIYDTVTALYKEGKLTHASTSVPGDKNLAQELQFNYYRDAYLALKDVEALGENPDITATAPDADGSEQYKALFKEYLYKTVAVAEFKKQANDVAIRTADGRFSAWQIGAAALLTTAYTNAPAEYVKIYTEIRDEQVRNDFGTFDNHLPKVEEADGPYEGKIPNNYQMTNETTPKPINTELSQCKVYLNEKLVGDQSFAIKQGRASLKTKAQSMMDTAYAAYQTAYKALAELQKQYEDLVKAQLTNEAKTCKEKLDAARKAANAAYDSYLADCETAELYLTDEYDERFILEGSGIQLSVCTEWTYNVVPLTGVDDEDYIMYKGEKHIAMYYDDSNPMLMHTEDHFMNRMVSLSSSHAYLDKNNEYYYNPLTGTLYYYNTNGISDLTFEYPTMNNMFYITNIRNLFFEDIAFTGLDYTTMNAGFTGGQASSDTNYDVVGEKQTMPSGAAIYGKMIRGVTIRNCNFHDLGCEAISFRNRVENTVIDSNTFTEIGSGAIRFGGATGEWSDKQGTENCVITNNYLNGIAQQIYSSPAITTQYSKDLECSYNTILNCSYSGYSIGWNWSSASFMYGDGVKLMHVDIHHNYIASFMQQLGDGGAIYTLGGNAVKEEHTLFNWCHDNYLMMTNTTGDGEGRFAAANYHDGSSSNWETYNTVVAAYSFGAAHVGDTYGHTKEQQEDMTEEFFATIDTDFTMDEYVRRLRNNYRRYWAYYEQYLDSAPAFNITLRDNFLINVRSTRDGTKPNTMFYEAYRDGVRAEDFIFVEDMSYVHAVNGRLDRIPPRAEDIIYDAGCDWAKGDPFDLADNNY